MSTQKHKKMQILLEFIFICVMVKQINLFSVVILSLVHNSSRFRVKAWRNVREEDEKNLLNSLFFVLTKIK